MDYNRRDRSGTLSRLSDYNWPLVLPCSVDSQPPALVTWYKDDSVLNERNVFQVEDGSLYFISKSGHCQLILLTKSWEVSIIHLV